MRTTITFEISKDLRDWFKIWCINNRTTVKQRLVGMIKEMAETSDRAKNRTKVDYEAIPEAGNLKIPVEQFRLLQGNWERRFGVKKFYDELIKISNYIPNAKHKVRDHGSYVDNWFRRLEEVEAKGGQGRKLTSAEQNVKLMQELLEENKNEV